MWLGNVLQQLSETHILRVFVFMLIYVSETTEVCWFYTTLEAVRTVSFTFWSGKLVQPINLDLSWHRPVSAAFTWHHIRASPTAALRAGAL